MNNLAAFFIRNHRFTFVVTLFFIFSGLLSLTQLTSESFPTVNIGSVIIQTYYRGANAQDIESKITKPIEDEIRSVSGIKDVRSTSQPGMSRIFTQVDIDNYDVEKVVADLQRAVDRTPTLPVDLDNPPMFIEIKTDEMPVIELGVIGGKSSFERNKIAYELSQDLSDNKKISSVVFNGYNEPFFNIDVRTQKLKENYVGINEVVSAISKTTVSIPAGSIKNEDSQFLVKLDGKIKETQKIGDIVIRSAYSGNSLKLSDVSDITLGEEDPKRLTLIDGQAATLISVAKKGGEDIQELSNEIKTVLQKYVKKYPEFKFEIYNDEGLRVGNRVYVLASNALTGLALVVFFLLIFLSGWNGVVTALSLPLAVMATLTYMQYSGLTLNAVTIMALIISIGMLVDNSVVIAENVKRLIREGLSPLEATIQSVTNLWKPITATALTTIAAFLPMMVTKGVIGQFIIGIPIIVTASLLFSLGESFFLLPMRLKVVNRKKKVNGDSLSNQGDWFDKYISKPFSTIIGKMLKARYLVFLGIGALILGSIFMMAKVNKFILFPANQTELYLARIEMPEGTPINKTNEALKKVSLAVIKELGDSLKATVALAGDSALDPSDPKGKVSDSVGSLKIFMTVEAKNSLITENVLKRLRKITLPESKRLNFEAQANGPPVGDPITLRVRSSNPEHLNKATQELFEEMEKLPGALDVRINEQISEQEIQVDIDTIKAQKLGLTLADIGQSIRVALGGMEVNNVTLNNREVGYFVQFHKDDRKDIEQLKNLMVMNRMGRLIPLKSFAKFHKAKGTPYINRFDYKRAKSIAGNVDNETLTSVEANNHALKVFKEISKRYPTVSLKFGGEAENTSESMASLAQAMILALIGIFALLVLIFNSFIRPFIIISTIPLGLVGVAVAFFLQGLPISFLSLIGIVGLSGIIVNSGIVLISFIEELRKESDKGLLQILKEASLLRLRAVIITSLTTVSGLIPTAYGIGGSDDFILPIAMSISWGLVSGTILTLLWVPCAYAISEDFINLFRRKKESV